MLATNLDRDARLAPTSAAAARLILRRQATISNGISPAAGAGLRSTDTPSLEDTIISIVGVPIAEATVARSLESAMGNIAAL